MALWTKITEGVVARKATNINVPEMDDMTAQLVINEALYEAGAASFAAIEISESIADFGVNADARGLSAMQYIAEAFSIGGFFKKIIEFLKKMWNTILNYFKALIGNKFGASGNIMKLINKVNENAKLISARLASGEIKADDEIKVRKYSFKKILSVALLLTTPGTYLDTTLLDDPTFETFKTKKLTITSLTTYAATTAEKVKGYQANEGVKNDKTVIEKDKADIDKALSDVKSVTSKLSLGEKGAVESLVLLLDKIYKNDTELKKTFEDSKAKDAKSVTEFIRTLLGFLFPSDAKILNVRVSDIGFDDIDMSTGSASGGSKSQAGIDAMALVDPIKASLTIVTDILSQLDKAGQNISTIEAGDVKTGTKDATTGVEKFDDDQSSATEYAKKMTEFGNEISKLSSNMQVVVTKGMDAGAVIFETGLKEILAQSELALKAGTGSRTKAKVNAAGDIV